MGGLEVLDWTAATALLDSLKTKTSSMQTNLTASSSYGSPQARHLATHLTTVTHLLSLWSQGVALPSA